MERIQALIDNLRELEKKARKNPGMEASHNFHPSKDYETYNLGHYEFGNALSKMGPGVFLELFHWSLENDHYFGDVKMPGVHRSKCYWVEKSRSLRTVILELLIRENEFNIWKNEDLLEMLTHPSWEEQAINICDGDHSEGRWEKLMARIIVNWRGDRNKILKHFDGKKAGEFANDMIDPSRQFCIDRVTLQSDGDNMVLNINFKHNLSMNYSILIGVFRKKDGVVLSAFDTILNYHGKDAPRQFTGGSEFGRAEVKIYDNELITRISMETWKKYNVEKKELGIKVKLYQLGEFKLFPF